MLSVLSVSSAHAAGPWFIRVDGKALSAPVVMRLADNEQLIVAMGDAPAVVLHPDESPAAQSTERRPHLQMALYWDARWATLAQERSVAAARLPAEQADQHGRLYPAACGLDGAIVMDGTFFGVRRLTPAMTAIFERYSIPTRLSDGEAGCKESASIQRRVFLSLAGVAAVVLVALFGPTVVRKLRRAT